MTLFDPAPRPRPGDALIVIPPFAALERPALGPHLLQACARRAGFEVRILYANLLLAARIGELNYTALCYSPLKALVGERVFAAAAYGTPPLAAGDADTAKSSWLTSYLYPTIAPETILRLAAGIPPWVDDLAADVAALGFGIVGCSTSFQQTAASVALLRRVKAMQPQVVTMLGGANCEGEMAEGVLSLDPAIDVAFSGESEAAFPAFLQDVQAGRRPSSRVIRGQPCLDLDALALPDFSDYYTQLSRFLPDRQLVRDDEIWLPYESSRGCWWGQKHHCTFCGLNGQAMAFRAKSADRVIAELTALVARHSSPRVTVVDNIMPHGYFRDLLPRLGTELPGLHVFYEQKANLSLANVVALKRAGVAVIQPGIEALSSSLLRRLDKGVSARQNIALLRYARAVDLSITWNLLYHVPGDELAEYQQTLDLVPLLRHLHPPSGLLPLTIDRFSPYFDRPAQYGVRRVRPWAGYAALLPAHADVDKVAYHFDADYDSASRAHPAIVRAIADEVEAWRAGWQTDAPPPVLAVVPMTDEQFLLRDTRGLPGTREIQFLTREQAQLVLTGTPRGSASTAWARERQLVVDVDGAVVPLATADPALLDALEADMRAVSVRQ